MDMKIWLYILGGILFIGGCDKKVSYLNGDVILVDDIKISDTLVGEKIVFDSINSGMISLCDSFAFFYNPRMPDYQYYCFNINTGKYVCNFFPLGRGNGEFLNVTPIIQLYTEKEEMKALFVAVNEEKAGVFNITKSIEQKTTICDTVFDFKWRSKYAQPFIYLFHYNDSTFLAYKQGNQVAEKEYKYSLPQFLMINRYSGDVERTYRLYHEPALYNPVAEDWNGSFYLSMNFIKPDKSKIMMSMTLLPQINILDVETGLLKGIRIVGEPGFEYLKGRVEDLKEYYLFSDVDDKYIYALYAPKSYTDPKATIDNCMIHIFDWEGNFIYKLYVHEALNQIRVDLKNKIIYGVSFSTEEVFRYPLPF